MPQKQTEIPDKNLDQGLRNKAQRQNPTGKALQEAQCQCNGYLGSGQEWFREQEETPVISPAGSSVGSAEIAQLKYMRWRLPAFIITWLIVTLFN